MVEPADSRPRSIGLFSKLWRFDDNKIEQKDGAEMWEETINIHEVREIRAKTTVYLGVGAIEKISDIAKELKKKGIAKVIVVTGKSSYIKTGAWDYAKKALQENEIDFIIYDGITPNPTVDQVDAATIMGREFGARAVLSIGGGSPIDAAKSIAILLEYPEQNARNLMEYQFTPEKAVPIVTVN
jgi:alcohol dehydrogenase